MTEKGYPFPLYSLDLIASDSMPDDEPRYTIRVPGGRLVVRRELRRQGLCTNNHACHQAVADGLARHAMAPERFAEIGLGPDWVASLAHWNERLRHQAQQRGRIDADLLGLSLQHGELLRQGRHLWRRLTLCADMAGLGGTVTPGPAPRGEERFVQALSQARLLCLPRADLLAEHGFGPSHLEGLAEVTQGLQQSRDRLFVLRRTRQECSDMQVVIRGALIGDLSRLFRAAQHLLPPDHARILRVRRYFRPGSARAAE